MSNIVFYLLLRCDGITTIHLEPIAEKGYSAPIWGADQPFNPIGLAHNVCCGLLKEADRGKFDLVAVGSRGLGAFRRALLGSVQ